MFKKGFSTISIIVIVLVVIAGGVLTWQYWPESTEQEPIITEDQAETDQLAVNEELDETVDWQTYTNIKFGYSLKYPNDFIVRPPRNTIVRESVIISKGKIAWFTIGVNWDWRHDDVTTAEKLAESIMNTNKTIEPYILDGIKGVKVTFDDTDDSVDGRITTMIVVKDDNLYDITSPTNSQVDASSALKILDQILSTFKFID